MKRTVRRLLLSALLFTLSADMAGFQQSAGNVVAGLVSRWGTNEPLSGVSVQLQPSGKSEAYEVQTGSDGRFQFRNIPNGDYTLAAVHSGFIRADYGRRRTSDPPFMLPVVSNRPISDIELRMIPSGAIFGRLTDGAGEPVAVARVRAWQQTFVEGQLAMRLVATVSTDDLGNYRIFSLSPGKYYVSAIVRAGSGTVPTFYSDTTDIRLARLVTLPAGSMAGGINITDRAETQTTVRGTVSSSNPNINVQLTPRIPVVNEGILAVSADARTGGFSMPPVAPGGYILTAISDNISTRTSIEVGNASIVDVRVAIPSPIEIRARVSLDPKAASIGIDASKLLFGFHWDSDTPNLPDATYGPGKDNPFAIRLAPGDYRMRALVIPPGAYVQSIRFGTQDVLNDGLHLDASLQAPLEIVIAADTGMLEGTVANAQKRPEPNVMVALIPGGAHRQRVDLIQNVRTNAEGRFRFEHVPPGDYSVYSWEDIEPTAWMNSDFMKDFENRGRPVHIDAGVRQTISVEVIPPGN